MQSSHSHSRRSGRSGRSRKSRKSRRRIKAFKKALPGLVVGAVLAALVWLILDATERVDLPNSVINLR